MYHNANINGTVYDNLWPAAESDTCRIQLQVCSTIHDDTFSDNIGLCAIFDKTVKCVVTNKENLSIKS